MQSNFDIIADLGNFKYNVQCLKCGHDFTHKSGQQNSFTLAPGKTTPLCPTCGAKDELNNDPEAPEFKSHKDAFATFGITFTENTEVGKEPYEIYDTNKRQSLCKTPTACYEQGKEWLEQDIRGNAYDGTLTKPQASAIKYLFPVKAPELLAFCRFG